MKRILPILLLVFLFLYSISLPVAEAEVLHFEESFEAPPNKTFQLVDGIKGKAARFSGREFVHTIHIDRRCRHAEVELHFNSDNAESTGLKLEQWRSLFHAGTSWGPGDFQLVLRNGRVCAYLHNGGAERLVLESEPVKNKTWYKLRFVIDCDRHRAALFLDDKEVDSKPINPEIRSTAFKYVLIGRANRLAIFNGMIDELTIKLKALPQVVSNDPRNIAFGTQLPHREVYADQPLIAVTPRGTWVCCLTVAPGLEGSRGQHPVAFRSTDHGKTWAGPYDIEPAESGGHYCSPLATPSGRVYVFYSPPRDGDKPADPETYSYFCCKYSDDEGITWSGRYWIPVRRSAWERQRKKIEQKSHTWFWCVSNPVIDGTDVFFPYAAAGGKDGDGTCWIVHSDNILTETDPDKIRWEILPEGAEGIYNPAFYPTQEEPCLRSMNAADSFVCVYRTVQGSPAITYSRDRCRSWSLPEKMCYADGRLVAHPRACPMIWRCRNGKYLFWGHNNSVARFGHRSVVWLSGGIEKDGKILWSQPDIALYMDDQTMGMSYPDLVEVDGGYWISETDKFKTRIHRIDNELLEGIWRRLENDLAGTPTPVSRQGLLLETSGPEFPFPKSVADLMKIKGLTLEFELDASTLKPGDVLLDNRKENGDGLAVTVREDGVFRFEMNGPGPERREEIRWDSDCDVLTPGKHRVGIVVDSAPRLIYFVVDGRVNDGNHRREMGWTRFEEAPVDLSGTGTLRLHPAIGSLRIYDRNLRVFELP